MTDSSAPLVMEEDFELDDPFDIEVDATAKYSIVLTDTSSGFYKFLGDYDDADTAVTEAACMSLEDFGEIPEYVSSILLAVEVNITLDTESGPYEEAEGYIFKKTFSVN